MTTRPPAIMPMLQSFRRAAFLAVALLAAAPLGAQMTSEPIPGAFRIDVSDRFEGVSGYNDAIRDANEYHRKAARARVMHPIKLVLFTASAVAGISCLTRIDTTGQSDNAWVAPTCGVVLTAAGVPGLVMTAILGSGRGHYQELERLSLERAAQQLPHVDPHTGRPR